MGPGSGCSGAEPTSDTGVTLGQEAGAGAAGSPRLSGRVIADSAVTGRRPESPAHGENSEGSTNRECSGLARRCFPPAPAWHGGMFDDRRASP